MKKLIGIIIIGAASLFLLNTPTVRAGNYSVCAVPGTALVQDTNPMPKRDSVKWNKKRHQDSTGRPRRDTTTRH